MEHRVDSPPLGPVAVGAIVVSCLLSCAKSPLPAPGQAEPLRELAEWLVDVTETAGLDFTHVHGGVGERYMMETMGAGGGFFDLDNDGWLDVYLVQGAALPGFVAAQPLQNRVYRNLGASASGSLDAPSFAFEDVTAVLGSHHQSYGMGVCFGDVDNDGFSDVYLSNFGADRLLRNDRGQRLVDVTELAGIDNPHWAASCAFADYDRDGCLDLYVVNYVDASLENHRRCAEDGLHVYCHPDVYGGVPDVLYRNRCNGELAFEDVSERAGIRIDDPRESKGLGVVWTDFDDDGDLDLYVANDSTRNFLYRNEGDGTFTEVGPLSGTSYNDLGLTEAGMGVAAGDVNGDGLFDLLVSNLDLETNTLYRNQGRGLFLDVTAQAGLAAPSLRNVGFGVNLFDVDNDGDLDLFVANGHILDNVATQGTGLSYGQRDQLFVGDGAGRFTPASSEAGRHFERSLVSRASAVGDLDNDGDLDLLITNNNQPAVVLENLVGDRSNSVVLDLRSRFGGRPAIGARAMLMTESGAQWREVRSGSGYLSQGDLRLHFGLGSATTVVRVEVRWPEGGVQRIDGSEITVNKVNVIEQGVP